jgi:hypothetical protein
MTDTDLHRPDPGTLRAAAKATELAHAVTGLVGIDGCRAAQATRWRRSPLDDRAGLIV